ncbi:MAG: TlyA family RNA methyltransferase [Nitrospinae bacterium]|nr:TlyA family RNA methyltransferase [Nitrospinota bacterium]
MSQTRKRLDIILAERGLAESRQRAQALILAGLVSVNGAPAQKAGERYADDAEIAVKGKDHPYVSRGGVKLAHAMDIFHINPGGYVCVDVGASTGGFTDCLLQRGAVKVYAIDVGENQLDYRLRSDPRVISMEKVNARNMDMTPIVEPLDMLVADVSFISLKLVIPPFLALLRPGAHLILLVKPQFEAGRDKVNKGIVRDESVHEEVLKEITGFFENLGLKTTGTAESPILGRKGNKEFLLGLSKS